MQPFHPGDLVLLALLNPFVAIVGLLMGRAADQPQKLVIAALTASIAGSAAVWLAAWLHLITARGSGGEGGLFILQCVTGLAWAAIGYYVFAKKS
jgi:hypothetical protein